MKKIIMLTPLDRPRKALNRTSAFLYLTGLILFIQSEVAELLQRLSFESFTRALIMLWLSPVITYEKRLGSIFITSVLPIYHLLLMSQYFIMPMKKETFVL